MTDLPITFFHPHPEELSDIQALDVDADWATDWPGGRHYNWVVQTYLRLEKAGYPVTIASTLPRDGVLVIGPGGGQLRALRCRFDRHAHGALLLVCIRADSPRTFIADVEVLQNGYYADGERAFFIPYWPQPGLLPRDASRGTRIETIDFKGATSNLHPAFRSDDWERYLARRGLRWAFDGYDPQSWHDYRAVDLVLGARQSFRRPYYRKPASKLVNAWMAGVPALLAPEYAYRELRESDLDYVEIRSADDAKQAIDVLLEHPEWYAAMVENGRQRSAAFTVERLVERWAEVLFEKAPQVRDTTYFRRTRGLPLPVRRAVNMVLHPPRYWEVGMWVKSAMRS